MVVRVGVPARCLSHRRRRCVTAQQVLLGVAAYASASDLSSSVFFGTACRRCSPGTEGETCATGHLGAVILPVFTFVVWFVYNPWGLVSLWTRRPPWLPERLQDRAKALPAMIVRTLTTRLAVCARLTSLPARARLAPGTALTRNPACVQPTPPARPDARHRPSPASKIHRQ